MHTNHVNCVHVEFLLNQHPYNVYLLSAFNTSFTDGFLCKSIGNFPDQNDCRKFYSCYTWIIGKNAIQYTCPSNAPFFHAKDEECRNITSGGMVYHLIFLNNNLHFSEQSTLPLLSTNIVIPVKYYALSTQAMKDILGAEYGRD